jgi:signal transduction histidine kinase
VKRFEVLAFGAVIAAAAVLAVLGYVSIRQWEASSDQLLRQQARDMAAMAAEKLDMAVRKTEDEHLASLERLLVRPGLDAAALGAWASRAPLFGRVTLLDRAGRPLLPGGEPADAGVAAGLGVALPAEFWERGGRRHVAAGGRIALVAALPGPDRQPVLAVLERSEEVLRRDIVAPALGGLEGGSALAVLDDRDRPVYATRPLPGTAPLLAVEAGAALPSWRVALYPPAGGAARGGVRRQAMLFSAAFALLLLVLAGGLAATYRVVRRETEMARLKSDFVANVSHDLKTPLSLIRMFAETLELGRVPDEATRREYYAVITRESERLTRLIDNVLDFSRIEGGRRRYALAPAAVEPLVHEVLEAFRYPLAQQGFKVEVDVAPDLPEVRADAEAVKQALANLVDNAIKYSAERRRLAVRARAAPGGVAIEVADDGVGIPPGELGRIFEKFYRVGASETQGRRGSGVGLALVQHVAEAHGGRIAVESRPGAGSRFTLVLPASREA